MRLLKSWLTSELNNEVGPSSQNYSWKPVVNLHNGPYHRCNHAICLNKNFIYLYGGRGPYGPFNDLWKYDIEEQLWSLIKANSNDFRLPYLEGHSLLCYDNDLILFGGETSLASANEVPLWKFNLKFHLWKKIKTISQKPVGRREHVAALYNGKMLIHGGYIDLKGPSDELWLYNIARNSWDQQKSCNNDLPAARYKHSSVVFKELFWISGGLMGITDRNETQVWTWHLTYSYWTAIKIRGAPSQLFNHAACVVGEEVMIFGGNQKDGQASSRLWRANLNDLNNKHSQIWKLCQFPDKVLPSATSNHCLVALPASAPALDDLNYKTSFDVFQQNIKNNSKLPSTATIKQFHDDSQIMQDKILTQSNQNNVSESHPPSIYSSSITSNCCVGKTEDAHEKENETGSGKENGFESIDLFDSFKNSYPLISTAYESKENLEEKLSNDDSLMNKENLPLLSKESKPTNAYIRKREFSYVNSSYIDSSSPIENETVKRFSYNLSVTENTWKTKPKKRHFQTTSFINIPSNYSAAHQIPSVDMKLERSVKFVKGDDNVGKVSVPVTFFKNASIMNDLEQNSGKEFTSISKQSTAFAMPSIQQTSLLLVGGCSNLFRFHQKETIHMWKCSLTNSL